MQLVTTQGVTVTADKLTELPKLSDRKGNSSSFCIFIDKVCVQCYDKGTTNIFFDYKGFWWRLSKKVVYGDPFSLNPLLRQGNQRFYTKK